MSAHLLSRSATSSLEPAVSRQDLQQLRQSYLDQGEFVVVPDFLPSVTLGEWMEQLELLKPHIHRNFIPKHKKGGSVAYDTVAALAPSMDGFYQSRQLIGFLSRLVDAPLIPCPPDDPHRCALYSYTEEGDHIGFHYDTSYYKDRRWTVLVGLQDESSSRLECHLHTRSANKARPVEKLSLQVKPGMMVIFNGDKVWHRVTPILKDEFRYIVSMQYVTNVHMNPFMRFVSNMKDAIAYFGLKGVFGARRRQPPAPPADPRAKH